MHTAKKQRGVAIIEFALVLPLLLILTFIVVEFGRAMYEYNTLLKATRDAVRYLSMQDPSIKTTDPQKISVAQNLAVYGSPTINASTQPLLPGLSVSNVPASEITWQTEGTNPSINTVRIRIVDYRFQSLVSGIFGVRLGDADGGITFGPIEAIMRAPA